MRRLELPDSGAAQDGVRRIAPSAERNQAPILAVLETVLPARGKALELASGTGQHIAAFARAFPGLVWQPSDLNPDNLPSIRAWAADAPNICAPMVLNACQPGWADAVSGQDVLCLTNLLHLISTPEAAVLLTEAAHALAPGGVFCLYGPFRRGGMLVSEGDHAFDASLRAQDPQIGYKDIDWVRATLQEAGLLPSDPIDMPAANLMLIARRPAMD